PADQRDDEHPAQLLEMLEDCHTPFFVHGNELRLCQWLWGHAPLAGQTLLSVGGFTSVAWLGPWPAGGGGSEPFLSSSVRSDDALRNSRMPRPMAPPTSGSLAGPERLRMMASTSRMIERSPPPINGIREGS